MAYNVSFSCDRCGVSYKCEDNVDYTTVAEIARGMAWLVDKRGWFCPFCKHKIREKM